MAHGHVAVMSKPFTPLVLGPELWLDASDSTTITASGGKVSQWNDKSGYARNVTQATSNRQPTTGSTTQNGRNVFDFAGGQLMNAATASTWKFLHDGTKWFACIVAKAGTSSNPDTAYAMFSTNSSGGQTAVGVMWWFDDRSSQSRNNANLLVASNGTANYQHFNAAADTWTPNQFVISSLSADLSNATAANRSSLFVNAGSGTSNNTATGNVSTGNPNNAICIGAQVTGPAFQLVGSIAELVIVAGSNATDANRQQIRDYLNAKWAVY